MKTGGEVHGLRRGFVSGNLHLKMSGWNKYNQWLPIRHFAAACTAQMTP
jgi:hypothetical protein